MLLDIISPSGIICHKEIDKVFFPGEVGAFEVLSNHAPLISNLLNGKIIYFEKEKQFEVGIIGGFVKIKDNHIEACVEVEKNDK